MLNMYSGLQYKPKELTELEYICSTYECVCCKNRIPIDECKLIKTFIVEEYPRRYFHSFACKTCLANAQKEPGN